MKSTLSHMLALLCAGLCSYAPLSSSAADRVPLLVYTALETDQIKAYKDAFEKAYPDVEIKWVRDSTGIITAKLLAEKANPQADVVMGVAASSLALMDIEGMLLPYKPKGIEQLNPKYVDAKAVPSWVGMDVAGATICFNTVEAKKMNVPKPETWKDLTKPIYKGKIVMPNPASSGTGYYDVTAWLQLFGEQGGWKYMDALHENVAQYMHSGSKPCKSAGSGEFLIGISFDYRGNQVKNSGAPIDLVFPKEGLGWDVEATGIMKNTKKLDAAKKLADWSASKDANELYQKATAIVANTSVHKPPAGLPANYEEMLIKNDFVFAARNREKILAEWSKRYDAKSEPK